MSEEQSKPQGFPQGPPPASGEFDASKDKPSKSIVPSGKTTKPPTVEVLHRSDALEKAAAAAGLVAFRASFSGPIPPPAALEAYARAFPECPERIVAMAENQAKHRQTMERQEQANDASAAIRVQYLGFVFGVLVLWACTYLIICDKNLQSFGVLLGQIITWYGASWLSKKKSEPPKPEPGKDAKDEKSPAQSNNGSRAKAKKKGKNSNKRGGTKS
jgi:uncharacterized membrane protein